MLETKTFYLPDLGEGLPDATIVEWHVQAGEAIELDAPLLSVETAKALVEVPAPYSGKLLLQHGQSGDVIATGAALADFELDPGGRQRAELAGHVASNHVPSATSPAKLERADKGTVVGNVIRGEQRAPVEQVYRFDQGRATPAVRALAHKLGIDLRQVRPSGEGGVITREDVKQAAAPPSTGVARAKDRTAFSAKGRPMRTAPPSQIRTGQPEQLKGVRRNMAHAMAQAHASVVPTSLVDDADLHAWTGKQDVTARLIRAIVAACQSVPALNAWFDGAALTRTVHAHVDVGIAVDTEDGLFTPTLRNADMLDLAGIRAGVDRLRAQVETRSLQTNDMSGHTISLSNFGMWAGRYATPVVMPPCVAIVGAGRLSYDPMAVMGGIEVHRRLPISLTFDHRAATGGEAARFMRALLDDLAAAS